jgi:hypothetical protein
MADNKIGRDGRIPKKGIGPIPIHNGQYFLRNGQLIAGTSRTQAMHPLDDSKMVHQPTVAMNLEMPKLVCGQRSRRSGSLN